MSPNNSLELLFLMCFSIRKKTAHAICWINWIFVVVSINLVWWFTSIFYRSFEWFSACMLQLDQMNLKCVVISRQSYIALLKDFPHVCSRRSDEPKMCGDLTLILYTALFEWFFVRVCFSSIRWPYSVWWLTSILYRSFEWVSVCMIQLDQMDPKVCGDFTSILYRSFELF